MSLISVQPPSPVISDSVSDNYLMVRIFNKIRSPETSVAKKIGQVALIIFLFPLILIRDIFVFAFSSVAEGVVGSNKVKKVVQDRMIEIVTDKSFTKQVAAVLKKPEVAAALSVLIQKPAVLTALSVLIQKSKISKALKKQIKDLCTDKAVKMDVSELITSAAVTTLQSSEFKQKALAAGCDLLKKVVCSKSVVIIGGSIVSTIAAAMFYSLYIASTAEFQLLT